MWILKYIRSWYYIYRWDRFNKPPPCKYLVMRKDGIIEFDFSKRRLTMSKINGIKCKDCKGENVFILDEGPHKGIYCEDCGAWIKWPNKKEYNLYKNSKANEQNKTDYIDRTDLENKIFKLIEPDFPDVMQTIYSQPSVDAVEVVRCEDCKYKEKFFDTLVCNNPNLSMYNVNKDFFCKYGEK